MRQNANGALGAFYGRLAGPKNVCRVTGEFDVVRGHEPPGFVLAQIRVIAVSRVRAA